MKRTADYKPCTCVAFLLVLLPAAILFFIAPTAPLRAQTGYPAWWTSRGVITGTNQSDYSAANQGQVKNIAVAAVDEFNADLSGSGGAGTALSSIAISLTATSGSTSDYATINIGQLKNVAQPFYDRLLSLGYIGGPIYTSGTYPWAASGLTADDYALANIGQVKNLFSFTVLQTFTPVISPNSAVVAPYGSEEFSFSLADQYGNILPPANPIWTVSGGGNINGYGSYSSIGPDEAYFTSDGTPGTYTITAVSGTVSLTGTVSVPSASLASLFVSPNPAQVLSGSQQQFTATGLDEFGDSVAIGPVTWSVNGGGSINSTTGLFTSSGGTSSHTVTASYGAVTGSAAVYTPRYPSFSISPYGPLPVPSGSQQQFTAFAIDQFGNDYTPPGVTWSVSGGGTIGSSSGLYTASGTNGTYTVTATSGTETATVLVYIPVLASFSVSSALSVAGLGEDVLFVASGTDQFGNAFALPCVTWSTTGSGTISSNGQFSEFVSEVLGTQTITATSGTFSPSTSVLIESPTLATVYIYPNPGLLISGSQSQFSASAYDQFGDFYITSGFSWSVSGGGTIDDTGLFTSSTTVGTFTVTAASGAVSSTGTFSVQVPALQTIQVDPLNATVVPGLTQQFTAIGQDQFYDESTPSGLTWSVSGGGTIDSTGFFTSSGTLGSFTVTATSGTTAGTAVVNVGIPILADIGIAPEYQNIPVSTTQQFVVTGSDQYGAPYSIPDLNWVATGSGTVNSTGLFNSGSVPGPYTVEASYGGIAILASGSVYLPVASGLQINPSPAALPLCSQQQFTASVLDQNDLVMSSTTATWSVSGGGSIDASTGLYTAPGTVGTPVVTASAGSLSTTGAINVVALVSLGIAPGTSLSGTTDWQGQLSVFGTELSGSYCAPTNAAWSGTGDGSVNSSGLVTLGGTTGVCDVTVTSGTFTCTATIDVYSTTASANGDGLSDWQNALIGISSTTTDINDDSYTNAQDIAMGIDPFAPYTTPTDPGDTTAPTITILSPPNAVLTGT